MFWTFKPQFEEVGENEEREDQVGTIWEGTRMENNITRQDNLLDLQAK